MRKTIYWNKENVKLDMNKTLNFKIRFMQHKSQFNRILVFFNSSDSYKGYLLFLCSFIFIQSRNFSSTFRASKNFSTTFSKFFPKLPKLSAIFPNFARASRHPCQNSLFPPLRSHIHSCFRCRIGTFYIESLLLMNSLCFKIQVSWLRIWRILFSENLKRMIVLIKLVTLEKEKKMCAANTNEEILYSSCKKNFLSSCEFILT